MVQYVDTVGVKALDSTTSAGSLDANIDVPRAWQCGVLQLPVASWILFRGSIELHII